MQALKSSGSFNYMYFLLTSCLFTAYVEPEHRYKTRYFCIFDKSIDIDILMFSRLSGVFLHTVFCYNM